MILVLVHRANGNSHLEVVDLMLHESQQAQHFMQQSLLDPFLFGRQPEESRERS